MASKREFKLMEQEIAKGHKLYRFGKKGGKILIVPKDMWAMKATTRHFTKKEWEEIKGKFGKLPVFEPFR